MSSVVTQANNVIRVDSYEPDFAHTCESCGASHVVTAVKGGETVFQGTMCGVCTWGTLDMLDPEEWNK
jgi:hypothetical protein